tara:strand:+ start:783 stop:1025 length:243 start_codon:yes stop_codon:yes gene_type:complete
MSKKINLVTLVDDLGTKLTSCRDQGGLAAVSRDDFNTAAFYGDAVVVGDQYRIRLKGRWYGTFITVVPDASYQNYYTEKS